MTLFEFLKELVDTPTIVGFENRGTDRIGRLCVEYSAGFFDTYSYTPTGSLLFTRFCGKKNAKKLVLDAHIDTIGFAVSEICGNGFVKVKEFGGFDPYVLPSAPIYLYGKQPVYGVFSSVPPHLAQKDAKKLEVSDLYVDTGLSEELLRENGIEIGTPCGYAEPPVLLQNNIVASHSLDDKACAATILHACRLLAESGRFPQEIDVCVHLSVGEEKTGLAALTLPYTKTDFDFSKADGALVMDVNFAHAFRIMNRLRSEKDREPPIRRRSSARLPILLSGRPSRKNCRYRQSLKCARPAQTPDVSIGTGFRVPFCLCRKLICTHTANACR